MNTTNATKISRIWIEFLNRSPATIAVETSILLLIGLIAIGGNLLVVISIYRNPSLRTTTNYFVISLSFTDILFPLIVTPISAVSSIQSRFVFNRSVCKFQGIVSLCLTYISIITIALMAMNRFVRVCKPYKYTTLFNKRASKCMISFVWLTSSIIVTVTVLTSNPFAFVSFDPRKTICHYFYNSKSPTLVIFGNAIMTLVLVLPLSVIIYCYYKVFKMIRQHKRSVGPAPHGQSGLRTSVREIKVTWTLFGVLVGYCLTWIPVVLIPLVSNIFGSKNLPRQVHMTMTYSGASSNAINPVIYGVLNNAIRREYVKIIKCHREGCFR